MFQDSLEADYNLKQDHPKSYRPYLVITETCRVITETCRQVAAAAVPVQVGGVGLQGTRSQWICDAKGDQILISSEHQASSSSLTLSHRALVLAAAMVCQSPATAIPRPDG